MESTKANEEGSEQTSNSLNIAAAISYEPFNQGFEPIVLMYNHLVSGKAFDTNIQCKSTIVTEANINDLVQI